MRLKIFLALSALLIVSYAPLTPTTASSQPLTLVWQSEFSSDALLIAPVDLAVDHWGNVYVSTAAPQPIKKFDSAGRFVTHWGENRGNEPGQFGVSTGIAVDAEGNVYVGDFNNVRIQKFDPEGNFLLEWATEQPAGPASLGVDADGFIYVNNFSNHAHYVQKFDPTGQLVHQWGSRGTGEGQFGDRVEDLALDADANVYVVDRLNHRVQKFDSDGNFLGSIGSGPSREGQGRFFEPLGVTVDKDGNIYIMDGYFLQKLDAEGNFITQWAVTEDSEIGVGRGFVTVDDTGAIYVLAYGEVTAANGNIVTPVLVKKFQQSAW